MLTDMQLRALKPTGKVFKVAVEGGRKRLHGRGKFSMRLAKSS